MWLFGFSRFKVELGFKVYEFWGSGVGFWLSWGVGIGGGWFLRGSYFGVGCEEKVKFGFVNIVYFYIFFFGVLWVGNLFDFFLVFKFKIIGFRESCLVFGEY